MALIELKNTANRILTSFNDLVTGILETLNPNGSVKKIFETWEEKAFNTKYQADTDGIVQTFAQVTIANHETRLIGMTDAGDPPTIYRCASMAVGGNNIADTFDGFSMAVKKGDFWWVVTSTVGGSLIGKVYWLPIGE